jgi:hypothetical protein
MRPPDEQESARLELALARLRRNHAYLAVGVARLGTVSFTEAIGTAAILVAAGEVRLLFNPGFFGRIDLSELGGVLVHEAMHFLLRHPARAESLHWRQDRYFFSLACDAVINDLIRQCFPELKLPKGGVSGKELVGKAVHDKSAEQVLAMLRQRARPRSPELLLLMSLQTTDEHDTWEANHGLQEIPPAEWTEESVALVEQVLGDFGERDAGYGLSPLGKERQVLSKPRTIKDLSQFLLENIRASSYYETIWTTPNRKLMAVYPEVILPVYNVVARWNVLIAIDTSGSVTEGLLSAAWHVANRKLPNTRVRLISFDTEAYELEPGSKNPRGWGGTRIQAVEDYILAHCERYPDVVFVITDGQTPAPKPAQPERWIWIMPPWGSTGAVPKASRIAYFDQAELPEPSP